MEEFNNDFTHLVDKIRDIQEYLVTTENPLTGNLLA